VTPTVVVPIRSFTGLRRLSGVLDARERASLMQRMATRTVLAARRAGLPLLVVSNDATVASWSASYGLATIPEPDGGGLNGAAVAGVRAAAGPWMILHADLPAIDPEDVRTGAVLVERGYVLAPSHDGGTSLIGGTGSDFLFQYGPGSFRRHLAAIRGAAAILVRPGLALDLDKPRDLEALRRLGYLEVTGDR